jgi:hypothetical protein
MRTICEDDSASADRCLRQGTRTPWRTRLAVAAAAALPLGLAASVYFPITRAFFWGDDFINLVSIVDDGFLPYVLRPYGGHNLLGRNLVFWVSHRLFGLRAELYFWTVLLTFLLDVWLLFRVIRNLTGSLTLASFGAALWGTLPVNDGTLAWYSVYGQVLTTTILLAVLDRVTARARSGGPLPTRSAVVWYALLLFGTVCFGIGVAIALVFPAVLFLLLPDAWRQRNVRFMYLTLPLATIALYFGLRRLYSLVAVLPEDAPTGIALPPVAEMAAMARELVTFAIASSLGSFAVYSGHGKPPLDVRIVPGLFAAGLLVLLWRGHRATRRAAAAMVVLGAGVYLLIAMGRAGLLIAFTGSVAAAAAQDRYYFCGSIPIIVIACLALHEIGRVGPLRHVPRAPLLMAALALGTWTYRRSTFAVHDNAAARGEFQAAVRAIDAAVAAHPPGATVIIETGQPTKWLVGFMTRKRDFPGRAAIFLLTQPGDELAGRRVRFIERDPAVLAWYEAKPGSRLGRLLTDATPPP